MHIQCTSTIRVTHQLWVSTDLRHGKGFHDLPFAPKMLCSVAENVDTGALPYQKLHLPISKPDTQSDGNGGTILATVAPTAQLPTAHWNYRLESWLQKRRWMGLQSPRVDGSSLFVYMEPLRLIKSLHERASGAHA